MWQQQPLVTLNSPSLVDSYWSGQTGLTESPKCKFNKALVNKLDLRRVEERIEGIKSSFEKVVKLKLN